MAVMLAVADHDVVRDGVAGGIPIYADAVAAIGTAPDGPDRVVVRVFQANAVLDVFVNHAESADEVTFRVGQADAALAVEGNRVKDTDEIVGCSVRNPHAVA